MKQLLYILASLVISLTSFSQNLVPNSGFEDYASLPASLGQFSLCDDWGNAASAVGTPDYYHTNAGLLADLPVTSIADVQPYEGDAILGFAACGKPGSNYREYVNVKLTQPLEVGKKYHLVFKITNGLVYNHSFGGYGVDQLGVHFSTAEVVQNGDTPLSIIPEHKENSVLFSRDWDEISFSFVASQPYEWMTIGVFGDDTDKTINFNEGSTTLSEFAYYFLDDFKMEEIPNEILEADNDRDIPGDIYITPQSDFPFFVPNAFTPDGDNQNDGFEVISSIPSIDFTVIIFDRWGNQIYEAKNGKPIWDGRCNGSLCPPDIYVWMVRYEIRDENDEKVTKEQTGTVHLIR